MRALKPPAEAVASLGATWALLASTRSLDFPSHAVLALADGLVLFESFVPSASGYALALSSSSWAASSLNAHLLLPTLPSLLALAALPAFLLPTPGSYGFAEALLLSFACAHLALHDGFLLHSSASLLICIFSATARIAACCALAVTLFTKHIVEHSEALCLCAAPLMLELASETPGRMSLPYEAIHASVLVQPFWAVYWVACVLVAIGSGFVFGKLRNTRKAFHAASSAATMPAIISGNRSQLSVCLACALPALVLVETFRAARLPPIGGYIADAAKRFEDKRDNGPFIFSHFALLFGIAAPVWLAELGNLNPLAASAGAIAVGAGDTAAACVGKQFGRTNLPGTEKTLEGTLAFILASLLALVSSLFASGAPPVQSLLSWRGVRAVAVPAVLEATVSSGWDNVVVSLYMCAALAHL